jgi:glycosyltransferase involved in cell wall biosynthesis
MPNNAVAVHYLTACLIFKDSAPYLDEWIRFHLKVGFDDLYLYDNDSSDDGESVIRPFVTRRQVTLRKWPGIGQQRNVFQNCLDTYRRSARWIAFIDDDEFLFPTEKKNLHESCRNTNSMQDLRFAGCFLDRTLIEHAHPVLSRKAISGARLG